MMVPPRGAASGAAQLQPVDPREPFYLLSEDGNQYSGKYI